ncbi:MAG: hypothetical protein A3C80_03625 [Candidatus Ryanbacteria bacterium RIFCSPHIGHO2_02_FULL_45_43]|uniref:Uncharacterized protein n=1 Tax=Candidatus Ryanbacteria bacterium RIFCSPHIGHO2_01_45_13 TaxID=1802112 RepID=A0A1G2FWY1_9BACT|nr:MAG: hypothetical protein A2W41_01720 [Candidatus Ryanbacteria bacterium RIFCSPHIGHO2_01_45_13]OGZ47767.1 MAG: hypothetical protein A3C80_03625 [Candidatus Ryanbacteria bacterium RIFCSPHIGHO2_02_FULL_45_43]OGZ49660.1 MAG: hypothetical protein A3E55_02080 [Candidatus Ryanbacteria bacterium RIFCSPHIGHO2_12_FULL_44_20]OGZ52153.1 MAG: hypothetical protein A3A17_02945 [Candidatus Ryanbacteria bacterium RIFCSPLOWO2_01_FULL_44_230]OGZ53599.1 MAG: hypothetical protein A3H62_03970 [Candidatus Ryanbac
MFQTAGAHRIELLTSIPEVEPTSAATFITGIKNVRGFIGGKSMGGALRRLRKSRSIFRKSTVGADILTFARTHFTRAEHMVARN